MTGTSITPRNSGPLKRSPLRSSASSIRGKMSCRYARRQRERINSSGAARLIPENPDRTGPPRHSHFCGNSTDAEVLMMAGANDNWGTSHFDYSEAEWQQIADELKLRAEELPSGFRKR